MKRQLQRLAPSLLIWIILVGLLGASQAGATNQVSSRAFQSIEQETQPYENLMAEVDSLNFDLMGHLGGSAQAVQVVGDYAYVGFGSELAILDISDPTHIQRVGWLVAAGKITSLAIAGDYAYIAYRDVDLYWNAGPAGLQIIDIHHPEVPYSISVKEISGCSEDESLVIDGSSVFFAYGSCSVFGGITVRSGTNILQLDITDASNPVSRTNYMADGLPGISGIAASSGRLYALFADQVDSRLVIFDTASQDNMVELVSFQTIPTIPSSQGMIALFENYALIAGIDKMLQVVDISDPSQPDAVMTSSLPEQVQGIFADPVNLYLVLSSSSIMILGASDPLNLVDQGTYQTTGLAQDVFAAGATAYSANGEFGYEIFDTADLAQIGLIRYPQYTNDLATTGNYTFSAADDGLWTLDVSNPRAPFPAAHLTTPYPAISIALKENFALVAYPEHGIGIIDISNPLLPALVNDYYLPVHIAEFYLVDNILFVAAHGDGLYLLDISDPNQILEIGSFMPTYYVNAVAVSGYNAYLATGDGKLVVLDISNPATMQEIGVFEPPNSDPGSLGSAVSVQGSFVLFAVVVPPPTRLAGFYDGVVWILDVTQPAHPVQVGRLPKLDYGWAAAQVAINGSQAYALYERQGLYLYDISNPGSVQILGNFNPTEFIYGMYMANERIYLYTQSTYLVRYLDPNLPVLGGVVTHANNRPYPGVQLSIGDPGLDQVTRLDGAYAFQGMADETYTIAPSLRGYTFSPSSRTISIPPSTSSQNFTILPEPVEIDFTPGISATLKYTDTQGLPSWLDIPANASAMTLNIQLVPAAGERSKDYAFAGHAFELKANTGSFPVASYVFDQPLVMNITYTEQDIRVVTDPDSLGLWWWNGSTWQDATQTCAPPTPYGRDPGNRILSVPICQTGSYKLMGPTMQFYLPVIFIRE